MNGAADGPERDSRESLPVGSEFGRFSTSGGCGLDGMGVGSNPPETGGGGTIGAGAGDCDAAWACVAGGIELVALAGGSELAGGEVATGTAPGVLGKTSGNSAAGVRVIDPSEMTLPICC